MISIDIPSSSDLKHTAFPGMSSIISWLMKATSNLVPNRKVGEVLYGRGLSKLLMRATVSAEGDPSHNSFTANIKSGSDCLITYKKYYPCSTQKLQYNYFYIFTHLQCNQA